MRTSGSGHLGDDDRCEPGADRADEGFLSSLRQRKARPSAGSRARLALPSPSRTTEKYRPTGRVVLPAHAPGMRIGLFGGTFDPPHEAHLAASLLALKRLNLDRVWWLVTPGNPLKNTRGLKSIETRIAAARALTSDPRIDVTGLEAVINTRYTYDTIKFLIRRCRGVRFVWIMGADNLRSFSRWQNWRRIAALLPIVIVDRVGPSLYATASVAAHALARFRIPDRAAAGLAARKPPVWVYLHGLKSPLSSTALRALRSGT
jgi:nicotinate-nucleotide adenylyltransferase